MCESAGQGKQKTAGKINLWALYRKRGKKNPEALFQPPTNTATGNEWKLGSDLSTNLRAVTRAQLWWGALKTNSPV